MMKKNQEGFIYIDALIGMVILSVALVALLVNYQQSTLASVHAQSYNQAVLLAQSHFEQLTNEEDNLQATSLVNREETENVDGVEYKISTTWLKPVLENAENIYQCQVRVEWQAPAAKTGSNLSLIGYFKVSS